jgi:signal transduction histidine kinase
MLNGALYLFYADDAAKWIGAALPGDRQAEMFGEATETLWEQRQLMPPSGRESMRLGGHDLTVIWQTAGGVFRALIATREFVDAQWVPAVAPVAREHGVSLHIGNGGSESSPKVKRSPAESGLPWAIGVTSVDPLPERADFILRQRLLIAGFVLLAAMALTASYLIVRAVRRELGVVRLQSDFVAAVSHEFRTPLTSLRQFTDMLRDNERFAPAEGKERRLLCYEAQSRATDRLTKLVESLLDFGRMEAGAHRYQFETRDCTELVERVVGGFREEVKASGAIDLTTGQFSEIFSTPGPRGALPHVAVSPDGRTLAMLLFTGGGDRTQESVALVGADGANFRNLYTAERGELHDPPAPLPCIAWANDGRTIFFPRVTDGRLGTDADFCRRRKSGIHWIERQTYELHGCQPRWFANCSWGNRGHSALRNSGAR